MKAMEGIIIEEMAKCLDKPYKTIAQRILCGGYKHIFSGNLYSRWRYGMLKKEE